MAIDDPIISVRHRALLSVTVSLALREKLTRMALESGVSVSEVFEEVARQALADEEGITYQLKALRTWNTVMQQWVETYPPIPRMLAAGKECVYFIHAEGSEFVKIGRSLNPRERLNALQISCMYRLKMIKSIAMYDASAGERALHTQLRPYRRQGEWFYFPAPFLDFLHRLRDD